MGTVQSQSMYLSLVESNIAPAAERLNAVLGYAELRRDLRIAVPSFAKQQNALAIFLFHVFPQIKKGNGMIPFPRLTITPVI